VVYEFHLVSADGDTAVRIEAVPLAAIPAYEATVAAEFAALPGGTYRWFVRAIGPTGHYVDSKERIFQLFHAGERAPGADSWATPGWLTFRWSPFPTAPGHVAGTYELVVEHDGVTRTVRTADTAYSLKLSAGRYAWYVRAIADGEVVYAWPTEWVEVGILGRFYCAPCPVRAGDPVRFVWEMLRPQAVEKLVLQVFSCTGELLFEMPVEPERDAYVWDRTVAGGKLLGPAVARLAGESRDGKRLEAFCKLAIYP
jgi:hypothetical protein